MDSLGEDSDSDKKIRQVIKQQGKYKSCYHYEVHKVAFNVEKKYNKK